MPWLAVGAGYFRPAYIGTVDVTYKAVELPNLPLALGVDFNVSQHFGPQSYSEVAFAPEFIWDWFPWNNVVYTTYRLGPLGVSYDTAISKLEETETTHGHTARLLNYAVAELTFSSSKDANWEVYVGVHHRCGVYGLVNGVNGGDSYLYTGFRVGF
jgi:hypothetical protein